MLCPLILALIYLPIQIPGLLSMLSILGLIISLTVMNKDTLAMALILLCGSLAGTFVILYSLPLPGYITVVLLGFVLAWKYFQWLTKQTKVIFWFVVILAVFYIWFLLGPQHAYSREKMLYIFVIGTVSLLGWFLYLHSKEIDIESLATFCLLSGLLYLSVAFDFFHFPRPSSLVDFDFFRTAFVQQMREDKMPFSYHSIGISAMIGVSFLLSCEDFSKAFRSKSLVLLLMCLWVALMSQARQAIFGTVALFVLRALLDRGIAFRKKTMLAAFIAIVGVVLITSVKSEALERSLNASDSTGFFNRDYGGMLQQDRDWLFGLGLGGFSTSGERNYPHNIILELLFELGIVGSLMIFIPLLAPYFNGRRFPLTATNQYAVLPIAAFGVRAMASGDLMANIEVISAVLLLSYWVNKNKKTKGV